MPSRHVRLLPTAIVLIILYTISAHGLQCKFDLLPYHYDLCPLLVTSDSPGSSAPPSLRHIHIHKDVSTPPTKTRNAYDIDLGGEGLKKDPTLPAAEQCPDGTWICLRVSNTRPAHPSEPRRILQIIPVAGNIKESDIINEALAGRASAVNASARLIQRAGRSDDIPSLEITLNGGWYLSRPQRAVISLLCDTSITEPSEPMPDMLKHLSSSNPYLEYAEVSDTPQTDTHAFTWATKHACPMSRDPIPYPGRSKSAEPPSATPPEGGESQEDEDNVAPGVPLSDGDRMRPVDKAKASGIIFGSLVALALLSYGVYIIHTQRRKQRYTSLYQDHTSPVLFSSLRFALPLPSSLSFSIPQFLRPSRRSRYRKYFGSGSGSSYDPLTAEEYEIQDEDDSEIVDFQRQGLLQGRQSGSVGNGGYGSVR